jgi:hypothetical protein
MKKSKSSYIARAQRFIHQISQYIDLANDTFDDIAYSVDRFNMMYHRHVIFAHGATRIALITSDYVIKIDYDDWQIARFGGCENEMKVYDMAKHDGMAYLFAEITPYIYGGVSYYIMPRVNGIGRYEDDAWGWMSEVESDWCEEHGIFDLHNENYGWHQGHVVLIDYGACEF